MNYVRLNIGRVCYGPYVANANRVALRIHLHDHVLDRIYCSKLVVCKYIVVKVAGFDIARRQDQIGGFDGFHDVENGESAGTEECRIEVDIDLADFASLDSGRRNIGKLLNLRGDGVVGKLLTSPLVQLIARYRNDRNGYVGDVELDDKGLQNAWWEAIQNLRDALHHLHLTDINVGSPVEPDLHGPEALFTERFDMFHIGSGTDGLFDRIYDALLDVERRRSFVNDTNEGDRNLDVREKINRQALERCQSQYHHRE